MAPNDNADEAATRLEEALERIARLARRPAGATETEEVAERLDALIAQLRATLAGQST